MYKKAEGLSEVSVEVWASMKLGKRFWPSLGFRFCNLPIGIGRTKHIDREKLVSNNVKNKFE